MKADFDTVTEDILSKSVVIYKKGRIMLKRARLCCGCERKKN